VNPFLLLAPLQTEEKRFRLMDKNGQVAVEKQRPGLKIALENHGGNAGVTKSQ
jgi:hypothetical protein